MGERYLLSHKGVVEEVHLPGKAVLKFNFQNQQQRVLLWVKGFVHQGKNLEQNDTFHGKLAAGDIIYFDCHVYDRVSKESRDNCGWYAPKAWKDVPADPSNCGGTNASLGTTPKVINQTGYIFELDPGKGVIQFEFNDKDQRVLFFRSKFYYFGKRPSNKHQLSEFLSENDPVQFDAEMVEPTPDNKMCQWFASLVRKGKKPAVAGASPWQVVGRPGFDEMFTEDSNDRDEDEPDFPVLNLPPGLNEKHGYKAFESSGCPREGKGNVVALLNEESGIALWLTKQNSWESVFFHRKHAFIVDTCLSKFDLQESLVVGTPLQIKAVEAQPDFPCKWIASKVIANC